MIFGGFAMQFTMTFPSPLGNLLLAADSRGLTGLWFEGSAHFAQGLDSNHAKQTTELLLQAQQWLELYFSGMAPAFLPPLHPVGTDFQKTVWSLLLEIPYGQTTTYGALAKAAAERMGRPRMSAQAVGGAVGRNPISILVPCHRVIGADGRLTGYAGGLDRKRFLLRLEGADPGSFAPQLFDRIPGKKD